MTIVRVSQSIREFLARAETVGNGLLVKSDAIERLSLAEQVAEKLSVSILSGDYRPGARLPETELAERFNVSRVPVREGLRLLAHQGLVQFRPRRGAIVPEVEASDIRDLYDVRAALLSLAAHEAAVTMTRDQIACGRQGIALMETLSASDAVGRAPEFLSIRTALGVLICQTAGNRVLAEEVMRLDRRALLHFAAFDRLERRREAVIAWRDLFDAFERRDPETAASTIKAMVGATRDELISQLSHHEGVVQTVARTGRRRKRGTKTFQPGQ